jgi:hypothetical protein
MTGVDYKGKPLMFWRAYRDVHIPARIWTTLTLRRWNFRPYQPPGEPRIPILDPVPSPDTLGDAESVVIGPVSKDLGRESAGKTTLPSFNAF